MKRIQARTRLREIPDVFTTNTLAAMLGGDAKAASAYLTRWRKAGLISSLGPRAGVHFNLMQNPAARSELWLDAVAYVFPGAVIAGVSAVHAAGWTTQIPARVEVMVPPRRSLPEIYGAVIETRPQGWFPRAKRAIQREGAVPTIDPAFALADLWHQNLWRPYHDDLELDLIDKHELQLAFSIFDIDVPADWLAELDKV